MNQPLLQQWNTHTDELLQQLAGFDITVFNTQPAAGAWSAGEVAEHLLMIDKRLVANLEALSTPVDRDPGEIVTKISTRLTDRVARIEAPAVLVPSENPKDRDALLAGIREERNRVAQLIQSKDMSLLNSETPHRFFGTMTGFEWVMFVIIHAQRHMAQLAEISSAVSAR